MSKGKSLTKTPAPVEGEATRTRERTIAAYPDQLVLPRTEPPRVSPKRSEPGGLDSRAIAGGMVIIDISEDMEVTGKLVCKVPVVTNVSNCGCGSVLSSRFNGSLFCRNCGQEVKR